MNDTNDRERRSVAACALLALAAAFLFEAGPATASQALPPDAAKFEEVTPTWGDPPAPTEPSPPSKMKGRWLYKDGKTGKYAEFPQDGSQEANPPPPPRSHRLHGPARAIQELLEGDPTAWTIFAGIVAAFALAYAVSLAFRAPRKTVPAEIVASWQKQRELCLTSAWAGIPGGIVLGVVAGVACGSALVFALVFCPTLFVPLVISFAKWRCPACGAGMGHNWNPRFCPKCGAGLQGAERPTAETPMPNPEDGHDPDGSPHPPP